MRDKVGREFGARVVGITPNSLKVRLREFYVDGNVHVSALTDDYYQLREEESALAGARTGRRFRLGDPLRVQVARVNRLERKIDFILLPDDSSPKV